MACGACASKSPKKVTYLHTAADGTTSVKSTEAEARAAVARRGGTYKAQ